MLWGVNFIECLEDVTIEQQDQEWTLTCAKNLCTNGLKVKVASIFDKIPGHQQTGVVYIWLMLDIIVNITPDVAEGLKEQLKQLGAKGLKGCYPGNENVESLATDVLSICEVLAQKGCLPDETPYNLLDGLSNSSHLRFAKVFADHRADLDNPMNTTKMEGTILE